MSVCDRLANEDGAGLSRAVHVDSVAIGDPKHLYQEYGSLVVFGEG